MIILYSAGLIISISALILLIKKIYSTGTNNEINESLLSNV